MVSKAPHPHAARLEHILTACKVPSQAAFMAWVGEKPQTWRNWSMRGVPDAKARRVRDKTGVDDDWLLSGKGTAFPNGPTLYAPPAADERVAALEDEVDDLTTLFGEMLKAFTAKQPDAGKVFQQALTEVRSRPGSRSPAIEVAADAVAAGLAAAERVAPTASPSGSPGRPRRR